MTRPWQEIVQLAGPIRMGTATSAIKLTYGCGHEINAINGDDTHHTCPVCYVERITPASYVKAVLRVPDGKEWVALTKIDEDGNVTPLGYIDLDELTQTANTFDQIAKQVKDSYDA